MAPVLLLAMASSDCTEILSYELREVRDEVRDDYQREARERAEKSRLAAQRPAAPRADVDALATSLAAFERNQQWPEAKAAWVRLLAKADDPAVRVSFARWLWAHDFNQEALTEARAIEAANPKLRGVHALLAVILAANHQPEEAERERLLGVAGVGADSPKQ